MTLSRMAGCLLLLAATRSARLEAQTFRRSIKTHLPVEAIPWFETGRYIAVFRDGRDAFMSFVNHVASFRDDVRDRLNALGDTAATFCVLDRAQ